MFYTKYLVYRKKLHLVAKKEILGLFLKILSLSSTEFTET